ncbi:hypothetical protein FE392_14060 [Xenorhabdus sp. 12]|uniref:Hemolysin XhlA n=2 Tax=Xenorhabdus santafensis TaxID=2582833 RepID=A0ABU4SCJ3_9GAMM|nr:hypothetical protein [Xenorhabdus sp. 12]
MNTTLEKRIENLESDATQIKIDVAVIKSNYATKSDIETINTQVHKEISSIRGDMALRNDIVSIRDEMALKSDTTSIHSEMVRQHEMVAVRQEISSINQEISSINQEISSIHQRISSLHENLSNQITAQTKWMVTMMFGFAGVIITAMKLMI